MGKVNKFEDFKVWQKANELAVDIYKLTSNDKLKHDYGLKDQIQRAAVSISNNIAEGFEYDNNKDFIKFLRYAKGSTGEVRSMLNFLMEIDYVSESDYKRISDSLIQLSKQLNSFVKYLIEYRDKKHD